MSINSFVSYFETEAAYDDQFDNLKPANQSILDFTTPVLNREFDHWEKFRAAFSTWMSRLTKDEIIFKLN